MTEPSITYSIDDVFPEAEIIEVEDETPSGKGLAKLIARTSVKFVIASSIASIAPEAETKIQKAKLAIGTYVLADMVSRSTGTYVETKIDTWKKDIREARAMIKKINEMVKSMEKSSESPDPVP